jgi:hypothetical protein
MLQRYLPATTALILLAFSFGCSQGADPADHHPLSPDEQYLVKTYVDITAARLLHAQNPQRSDSLFARIDSTVDSQRISKTVHLLNSNPDRWFVVFSAIEEALKNRPSGER